MKASDSLSVYDQVVQVTHVYLGPAAERFIGRQVENHLNKSPQDLTKKDLRSLIVWIQAVVSLITEDKDIIEEYTAELRKVANS